MDTAAGIDDRELSRYWLLSDGWSVDHRPCALSMRETMRIVRSMGILVMGRIVEA